MKKNKTISRRQFLIQASISAAGGSLLGISNLNINKSESKKDVPEQTAVVLVRNKAVLDQSGNPDYGVVLDMLDRGVTALMGDKDPVACWKKLLKKDDVVGIKSNVWRYLPTTPQVENAIKKRVLDAGIPQDRIGVGDRGILQDPIFTRATALINARPMRSHHWSGVGSLIKNYIMFIPNPPDYHHDSCADLAAIWGLPLVKGKTRLNILVMFTPQFHGVGPHSFNPKYVWKYYGLLVGFDPVAVDSVGVRILLSKRRLFFGADRPLNPPPKHIWLADTRHGLGTADPEKIKLIKLGYETDRLI